MTFLNQTWKLTNDGQHTAEQLQITLIFSELPPSVVKIWTTLYYSTPLHKVRITERL